MVESLNRILSWCARHAPHTAQAMTPPAERFELDFAQRRTGGWNWPDDLLEFYARCNGFTRSPAGNILVGYRPLSLGEVVEWWETSMSIALIDTPPGDFPTETERARYFAQLANDPTPGGEPGGRDPNFEPAGTPVGHFISSWLPIAEDQSGDFLMIDRRSRSQFGAVISFDKVDADISGCSWPSLDVLISAVADAMENGTSVREMRRRPVGRDGHVTWAK